MPAKLVVVGKDVIKNGKVIVEKGDIASIVTEGGDWGSREVPPDFVRLTITDATRDQVTNFIEGWQIDFVHTRVDENAAGWRYRIEVDPAVIAASELGKSEIKQEMRDYIDDAPPGSMWHEISIFSFSASSMTIDIPKNTAYQTGKGLSDNEFLKTLREDITDVFKFRLKVRRYYLAEADVDFALAQPNGEVSVTKAQALSRIIDKLED